MTPFPESATEYQLKLLRWQFFATYTWSPDRAGSFPFRRKVLERHLGNFAKKVCGIIVTEELPFAVRWERGETGGHPHCHLLIAGAPPSAVNLNTCFATKNSWKWGVAQVRLYDPQLNGQAYMQKGRFSSQWAQGANAYELKKFNGRNLDLLHISRGAMKLMMWAKGVTELDLSEAQLSYYA
jgi:hypothetical protein